MTYGVYDPMTGQTTTQGQLSPTPTSSAQLPPATYDPASSQAPQPGMLPAIPPLQDDPGTTRPRTLADVLGDEELAQALIRRRKREAMQAAVESLDPTPPESRVAANRPSVPNQAGP